MNETHRPKPLLSHSRNDSRFPNLCKHASLRCVSLTAFARCADPYSSLIQDSKAIFKGHASQTKFTSGRALATYLNVARQSRQG